jgi:mycothiol system anti-sigma-R factor
MTCEEAVKKLYEYLDKELDIATTEQIDKHMELCRSCCDHMEFEKNIRNLVQQTCIKEKAPVQLRNKIMGKLNILEF